MIDKMPLKSNDHNSTIQTAFATLLFLVVTYSVIKSKARLVQRGI